MHDVRGTRMRHNKIIADVPVRRGCDSLHAREKNCAPMEIRAIFATGNERNLRTDLREFTADFAV